jgi:hypothetical protein
VRQSRDARPFLHHEVSRPVDVDVTDAEAAQVSEIGGNGVDGSSRIRLDVSGDLELDARRRADDGLEALVFQRATTPPGRDHLVDAGRGDLTHLGL